LWGPSRHLGSLTAANWVSFDFNVSYSSCWGYSLINTFKLKKSSMDRGALPSVGSAFMPARGFYVAIHTLHFWMHFIKQEQQFWKRHSSKNITIICHIILHITRGADRTRNLRPNKRSWWTPHHAFWTTLFPGFCHCAEVLQTQVPKLCTALDLGLIYISILGTYSKFARKNNFLSIGLCFPQLCSSAGCRFAAPRSRLQNYWRIVSFP